MKIYVARHGEELYPDEENTPLSPQGVETAINLGKQFRHYRVSSIWAGETLRSKETGEIARNVSSLGGGSVDFLNSLDFGRFIGTAFQDDWNRILTEPLETKIHLSELGVDPQLVSLISETTYDRIVHFLTFMWKLEANEEGPVGIVTHTGMMCALLAMEETGDALRQFEYPIPAFNQIVELSI